MRRATLLILSLTCVQMAATNLEAQEASPPPEATPAPEPSPQEPSPTVAPVEEPAPVDRFGPPLALPVRDVEAAIALGAKAKGRLCGLDMQDSARGFFNAMAAMGSNPGAAQGSRGFSLEVFTPLSWIEQLSSNATKEYRAFSPADLTREDLAPVLRVVIYPDLPLTLSASSRAVSDSVQHVVVRDEAKRVVAQPLAKDQFTQETSNAMGGRADYAGLRAVFSLEDVARVRAASPDHEFFVTVVGQGSEKNFKIKKKHFEKLPGLP